MPKCCHLPKHKKAMMYLTEKKIGMLDEFPSGRSYSVVSHEFNVSK